MTTSTHRPMSGINLRNTFASADISRMTSPDHEEMYGANRAAGEEIRAMFLRHGITPEDVPPEPHISEAKRIAQGQIPLELMLPPESAPPVRGDQSDGDEEGD